MRTHVTDTPSGAESVQQLAVLLEAGIAPTRAWQLLAEAGDPVAADVASAPPGTSASWLPRTGSTGIPARVRGPMASLKRESWAPRVVAEQAAALERELTGSLVRDGLAAWLAS